MIKPALALIIAAALSACSPIDANAQQEESQTQPERPRGHKGAPPKPDLSEAAATLGISEEVLDDALRASGGPPPNLAKAAAALGIEEADLKKALPKPPPHH